MRIALVPLYVRYYESVVPSIREQKNRLVDDVKRAVGGSHTVDVFAPVTDVATSREANCRLHSRSFDALIVLPLVATFSQLSDELVRGWTGPLLLVSVMAGRRLPQSMTMPKAVAESQSFGSQAIANGWMRQGARFTALHVMVESPEGRRELQCWLEVQECVRRLRGLRIGLVGEPFEGMTDVLLPEPFADRTGAVLVRIPMQRLHASMRDVSVSAMAVLEADLRRRFVWKACSDTEKQFSLRAALAIRRLAQDAKLDCAAFNSHGPEGLQHKELGVMAALGVTLATSSGCPMSEVGDLCTALAMWLGRCLSGACYYTELDSAYMSRDTWLLLNSGEFDEAWLRPGSRPHLVPNTNFAGLNGRGLSVCAPLREGPATILNFSPTPKAEKPYRILYCEGRILKRWYPGMGVGNAHFQVAGDARRIYERWLSAGPVHHSATVPGHLGSPLRTFCAAMDWAITEVTG